MLHCKKVVVVLPPYRAAKTLERTVREIPADVVDEVILVDDASSDETVELSLQAGTEDLRPRNQPRLRGQPEDVLSRGAQAGRRYRGHALPRLPV